MGGLPVYVKPGARRKRYWRAAPNTHGLDPFAGPGLSNQKHDKFVKHAFTKSETHYYSPFHRLCRFPIDS
jgi:hypothetical protein